MTVTRFEQRPVRTELAVGGMNCGSCCRYVESALAMIDGVAADADVVAATVVAVHPTSVSVGDLVAAIEDAGYTVEVGGRAAAG